MVTTFYPPYHFGGDGVFVYRLSNELAQRGHTVSVIHNIDAYHALHPAEPCGQYANHPNITVHGMKSRAAVASSLLIQQTGGPGILRSELQGIIECGKYDVIHYHNISLIGPQALEYGGRDAVKLYTMHEYWLVCPTHILFKYNREACSRPNCFMCSIAHKRPPQLWRYTGMLERSLKHVDAFISPSKFTAQMHKAMGLTVPTVHIPMFVPAPDNRDVRACHANRRRHERPYFLFVGRLEKIKGLHDVLQALRHYDKADLLIIGTGTYEDQLRSLGNVNQAIKFLGPLPYDELAELYEQAIAVIVPSLCYETFGQIIVEAFSFKTPVIVKDIGALRELVTESGGGELYQGDAGLIAAMERFRLDRDFRDRCGQLGYRAYQRLWTTERYFAQYFALIDEIRRQKHLSNEALPHSISA
jgi:glycosyltransferase involved in cell wall biosynthesis